MYSINKHCILTPTASQNTYLGEQCSPKTPREDIEKFAVEMYNKDKFEFIGEQMRKQIANIITSIRILCSICLLLCPVFSVVFYIVYLFCGITDMVDGRIARKTKSVSETGARLDTVADIVFVAVCFVKILPLIQLPTWLWIWIVVIAAIKIVNVVWGLICNKKLLSIHTILNKATGFLLFLFPLTLSFIEPMYSSVTVCSLATVSAINEVYYTRRGKEIF